jgi:hypothetical protein
MGDARTMRLRLCVLLSFVSAVLTQDHIRSVEVISEATRRRVTEAFASFAAGLSAAISMDSK